MEQEISMQMLTYWIRAGRDKEQDQEAPVFGGTVMKVGTPCCERVGTKLGVRPVSGVVGWGLGEGADWHRTRQGRGRRGRLPNAKSSREASWPGTASRDGAIAMPISQELFGRRGGWEWRDPVSGAGRGKITLVVECDVSQIHINYVKISELLSSTYMCQERF